MTFQRSNSWWKKPKVIISWHCLFKYDFIPWKLTGGIFLIFFMYVLYSTLLHLPPLRFHSVGECWDRTQDSCFFGIGWQTLWPLGYISSTNLHLIHILYLYRRICSFVGFSSQPFRNIFENPDWYKYETVRYGWLLVSPFTNENPCVEAGTGQSV